MSRLPIGDGTVQLTMGRHAAETRPSNPSRQRSQTQNRGWRNRPDNPVVTAESRGISAARREIRRPTIVVPAKAGTHGQSGYRPPSV